jgi:hypothetical protein
VTWGIPVQRDLHDVLKTVFHTMNLHGSADCGLDPVSPHLLVKHHRMNDDLLLCDFRVFDVSHNNSVQQMPGAVIGSVVRQIPFAILFSPVEHAFSPRSTSWTPLHSAVCHSPARVSDGLRKKVWACRIVRCSE